MKNHLKLIIAVVLMAVTAGTWGIMNAGAMASIFMAPTKSAAATTTMVSMTFGTGTTTITLATPWSMGMSTKYDKALVMVQVYSTTSPGRTAMRVEHSLDGIDWFSFANRAELAPTSPNATSSVLLLEDLIMPFSTSTIYVANGTTTASRISFYIETPTPYNRVVFYRPSPNAGEAITTWLWAAIQPIKEVQVLNQ
jgi:hypothetical protein